MLRNGNKWDRRIERARELAGRYAFATEILTFYAKLAAFQQAFQVSLESDPRAVPASARDGHLLPELGRPEFELLMPRWRPFLSFLAREGTPALAGFANSLQRSEDNECAQLLMQFWPGGARERSDEDLSRFAALAFLQPYAEYLAARADAAPPVARRPVCPFCGSKPVVGVLRPEGDGAKRSLVCSFCYREWDYLRIACPACEESRDERMGVYVASQFEHVRVETCEACGRYIKTVDLTKNGLAVPEVDELAAIPLTLWADDKGYAKLSRNLFGS